MAFSLLEFLTSIACFLIIWLVLGNFVFKPFFALLALREERTTGSEAEAVNKKQESKKLASSIEQDLRQTRLDAYSIREEKIKNAKIQAQSIIDLASAKVKEELGDAEKSIKDLKQKASSDITNESSLISKAIIKKVLSSSNITIH